MQKPVIFPNGMEVKNQMVMAPLTLLMSELGHLSNEEAQFLLDRAQPFGMIIVGAHAVQVGKSVYPNGWSIGENLKTEAIALLLDQCHKRDIRVVLQLYDGSNVLDKDFIQKARQEDLESIIEAFAQATAKAIEAGFDGVEIHGANSFLIHEFLSPKTNHRSDAYGQDRSLFLRQVVRVCRKMINTYARPFLLGYRMIAEEFDGGISLEDSLSDLENFLGQELDYVHLSLRNWRQISQAGDLLLERIKAACPSQLKLICSGKIHCQEAAEKALAYADFVSVGSQVMSAPSGWEGLPPTPPVATKLGATLDARPRLSLSPQASYLGPMTTMSAYDNGAFSYPEKQFYIQAAKRYPGIFVGATGISPQASRLTGGNRLDQDRLVPSYQNITRSIHAQGAWVVIQLYHAGWDGNWSSDQRELIQSLSQGWASKEDQVNYFTLRLKEYGHSIDLALKSGFDAVELSWSTPSFWTDLLDLACQDEAYQKLLDQALTYLIKRAKSHSLGIRLNPEWLLDKGERLAVLERVLGPKLGQLAFLSLNVSHVLHLKAMVAVEKIRKLDPRIPVFLSGGIRTQADRDDVRQMGCLPMEVRPYLLTGLKIQEGKSKSYRKAFLPPGLRKSMEEALDWYFS